MEQQRIRFVIVGPGPVGTTLARMMVRAGHECLLVVGRSQSSLDRAVRRIGGGRPSLDLGEIGGADWIAITTPDREIAPTASELAARARLDPPPVVSHCSGALDASLLEPLARRGCPTATLHPLLSFADVERAERHFEGTFCFLEGAEKAIDLLARLVEQLGARPVVLQPGSKVLYHAAAVIASNDLVAGTHLAVTLMGIAGVEPSRALEALLPLLESTLDNLRAVGLPAALTGPVARGDVDVVRAHLVALEQRAPDHLGAYRALGRAAVELAAEKGNLAPATLASLRALFPRDSTP